MVGFAEQLIYQMSMFVSTPSTTVVCFFSSWCTWRAGMCLGGQKEPIHLVGFEAKRNLELDLILL